MAGNIRTENFFQVTPEQWDTMSPEQQRMLQFNADLQAAVNRDRANQFEPTEQQRQSYQETYKKVFGETVSPTTPGIKYAPETLALLSTSGINEQTRGTNTLADYLNLDAAFTVDEIQGLNAIVVNARTKPVPDQAARIKMAQDIAAAQLALNPGEQLSGARRLEANAVAQGFGAEPIENLQNSMVMDYLRGLATQSSAAGPLNPTDTWAMIQQDMADQGLDERETQEIITGMKDLAVAAAQGKAVWFDEPGSGNVFRSPQETARMLGVTLIQGG